ncbi:ligand-dependent nuclear receptor corepressor-like protein [Patella vulgata]|uniref:ligand-dependent nuclear receptor corepressor-like protein n=1 Tax=Patella vulgata TaxID=6465 RepID=UPI00217FDE81|nr:ligand-dependent nuclear receptor corepressor-like protein [Patella vulgata]
MVDCGNPRCAQDRRSFRKELLSWGKKVPVLLAYEAIAGRFGGKEVSDELDKCFNSLESDEPEDFAPENECIYCESKLASIVDIVSKLTDDAKKGKIDPDNAHLRYLHDLLPFCTQYYTTNIKKESEKRTSPKPEDVSTSSKLHIELKVPQIPQQPGKNKKDILPNGKRGYTDDDLVSAVCDIRNGKLGTRRASTLYGIPRSTLRNKIFKMEIEDQSSVTDEPDDSNSVDESSVNNTSSMKLTDLMQAGSLAFLPPIPFLLPYQKQAELTPEEMERKMEQIRHKHNIDGSRETSPKPAHINELKLPLLADLIHKLVEQRFEMECQKSASKKKSNSTCSSSSSNESQNSLAMSSPYYSPLTAAYLSSLNTSEDPDIRIPSYKSATTSANTQLSEKSKMYGKVYDGGRIGETLKDIIMKTITEKMRFKDGSDSSSEAEISSPLISHLVDRRLPQMTVPNSKYSTNNHTASKRRKESEREKTSQPANSVKKTRPKRGQYRKYNSALLMEAVRAVQRGEMSVHRAGSYYGVPHSTLEYKVKERHLLRQKKMRDTQTTKESKTVTSASSAETSSSTSSPASSKTTTTTKSESTKLSALGFTPSKDSTNNLPWYQPYLNANPEFKADMNFFPSGFALSTPASELLRKLQHKVQSKSSPFSPDSSFEFTGSNHNVSNLGDRYMLYN